jgi:hypothetical protein
MTETGSTAIILTVHARSHLRRFWLIAAMLDLLLPSLASVADARA